MDSPAISKRTVIVIFVALMAAMFLSALDQSVVGTALPTIVGELGAVQHEGWIITTYVLAIAVVMPIYGKLGDAIGRRIPFLISIAVFTIGAVFSALAPSFIILIIARAVQGLGGGGLMILSQAIMADIVSARDRGKYMGPMGAIFGVATVVGPLIGGWLTEGPGWRWCFWIDVPVGVIAFFVGWFALKLPRFKPKARFDYWGTLFIVLATTGLILVTSWSSITPSGKYDWHSPALWVTIVITVISAVVFVLVERKAPSPLVPLIFFRKRIFVVATIIGFVIGIVMFAALSYLPTFLQMTQGASPVKAGLLMLPLTAGLMITSIGSGFMIAHLGKYRIFPIVGMAITTGGLVWMTTLKADMSMWLFGVIIFIVGAGLGLVMQTIVIAVQNDVEAQVVGVATSTNNFFREIGGAIGTSFFGAVFTGRLAHQFMSLKVDHAKLPEHMSMGDLTPKVIDHLPPEIKTAIGQAYTEALAPSFWYLVPLAAIAFIVALFLQNRTLSNEAGLQARETN